MLILFSWCKDCGEHSDVDFNAETKVGKCPLCGSANVEPHVSPDDKIQVGAPKNVVFRAAKKYRNKNV